MDKKIYFDSLTDDVVGVLAEKKFPVEDKERFDKFLEDTHKSRVLAVMEYPYIDIELEAWTKDGFEPASATETDNGITLMYFVCIKGVCRGDEVWNSDDYAGACTADFSSPNWRESLIEDMDKTLADFAETWDYSYTEPNFNYD